jgi:3-oxoacyl-[acyl-carrier protein] reductase
VHVNSLNPGIVDTPMLQSFVAKQPDKEAFWAALETLQLLKRVASAEELANAALFLASDEASYVTGSDMLVDGGLVLG